MKVEMVDPPRKFTVRDATIEDCARITLEPGEQVTFVTDDGSEYDVARKSWGFYATPSLNARLVAHGWDSALVQNRQNRYYVMLVERSKREEFVKYIVADLSTVICWLHDTAVLDALPRTLRQDSNA